MNLEDIKSYKDACKIINRKPRRYYVKTTFEILLRQWFDADSIK